MNNDDAEDLRATADVTLASPKAGEPLRVANHFVVIMNTNEGTASIDVLNRTLRIHLEPTRDFQEQPCAIGKSVIEVT